MREKYETYEDVLTLEQLYTEFLGKLNSVERRPYEDRPDFATGHLTDLICAGLRELKRMELGDRRPHITRVLSFLSEAEGVLSGYK